MSDPVAQLREFALSLPAATEEITWGHPTFRVGGKIFATCGSAPGSTATMSVKSTKDVQPELLAKPGFFRPDYVGSKGWVGIELDGRVPWAEIEPLVERAWALTAPKRLQRGR
ncbi:hypothetical protein LBMAG42_46470 [Deltaproteobacteria bacterium]|nr:hypothetical protein LBMAG42_46470 [Deltaproteobacteria bacterium]